MQFTMAPPETSFEPHAPSGVMAPPEGPRAYRPLMGSAPRPHARGLCAAHPEAELPSMHGFLWAVVWVVATVLLVATYAFDA